MHHYLFIYYASKAPHHHKNTQKKITYTENSHTANIQPLAR